MSAITKAVKAHTCVDGTTLADPSATNASQGETRLFGRCCQSRLPTDNAARRNLADRVQ